MTGNLDRLWIVLGALAGLGAVALSALDAHGLGGLDPTAREIFRRGLALQGWHAPALALAGIWGARGGGGAARLAGLCFALGLIAFCGDVYLLSLAGISLGMVAPAGGGLLMLGWALLALSGLRGR